MSILVSLPTEWEWAKSSPEDLPGRGWVHSVSMWAGWGRCSVQVSTRCEDDEIEVPYVIGLECSTQSLAAAVNGRIFLLGLEPVSVTLSRRLR